MVARTQWGVAIATMGAVLAAVFGAPATVSSAAADSSGASTASTPTPPAVSVSITDGTATARAGDHLGYQAIVANRSSTDLQLLLEITLPPGAKVADVGGGTSRNAVIDFALTVLGPGRVIERFTIVAGPATGSHPRVDTVASVYVLGGASGAGAEAQATDSDSMVASGVDATSVSQGAAGHDADGSSASAQASDQSTSPAHEGLWVAALVLGVLLVISGLALALWRGSDEREPEPERSHRAPSSRVSPPTAAVTARPGATGATGRHGHRRPNPSSHSGNNGHGAHAAGAADAGPAGWARADGLNSLDWDDRGRPAAELFDWPNRPDGGDISVLRPPAEVYHLDR
jgi:hypothetical protein